MYKCFQLNVLTPLLGLIEWMVFFAVSAICHPYNGGHMLGSLEVVPLFWSCRTWYNGSLKRVYIIYCFFLFCLVVKGEGWTICYRHKLLLNIYQIWYNGCPYGSNTCTLLTWPENQMRSNEIICFLRANPESTKVPMIERDPYTSSVHDEDQQFDIDLWPSVKLLFFIPSVLYRIITLLDKTKLATEK